MIRARRPTRRIGPESPTFQRIFPHYQRTPLLQHRSATPNPLSSQNGSVYREDCKCNSGFSGPAGGPCTACAAGTYSVNSGALACTPCTLGVQFQNISGQTFCMDCTPVQVSLIYIVFAFQALEIFLVGQVSCGIFCGKSARVVYISHWGLLERSARALVRGTANKSKLALSHYVYTCAHTLRACHSHTHTHTHTHRVSSWHSHISLYFSNTYKLGPWHSQLYTHTHTHTH